MDQIQLNIKVNGNVEFQDQRIQAGLNWDIKKLKGVLSEIYKVKLFFSFSVSLSTYEIINLLF